MNALHPTGEVVGPCVCGSWPGGKCLRCHVSMGVALPYTDCWGYDRQKQSKELILYTAAHARAYGDKIAQAVAKRCAEICREQAKEPECPERAPYCADAILAEFGIEDAARQEGNQC